MSTLKKEQLRLNIAREFSAFAVNTQYKDIPSDVVEKAKQYLYDTLGCAIGARNREQSKILQQIMQMQETSPQATVWGCGMRVAAPQAALLNGTNAHILDYDDDHREGVLHPSAVVLPAALAMAELQQSTSRAYTRAYGEELLRAYILGSELADRLGMAFLGSAYDQGFHPTGICGVFGGALACALLCGLDELYTAYALGLAGSVTSGTWEWRTESSWQKPFNAGNAAQGAVLCALMAEKGFVGTTSIFDGPDNFIRAHAHKDHYDLSLITKDLGTRWLVEETSIKLQACCRFAASAGDLAVEFFHEGIDPKSIAKVVVTTCTPFVERLCNPPEAKYTPMNHVDAQFSLPYVVGVGLLKGQLGVEQFEEATYRDPELLDFLKKIECTSDEESDALYLKAYPARVTIHYHDGSTRSKYVSFPKGDPENPASFAELTEKFTLLTKDFLTEEQIKAVTDIVFHLEKVSQISLLMDMIIGDFVQ